MGNQWIQKRGTYWVIVQRGSNRVLSRHRSRKQADTAMRAIAKPAIPRRRGK